MKILVIFTGGTIGSNVKKGWISTDDKAKYTLLDSFGSDAEFTTSSPYTLLSENLSANQLNILQEEITNNLNKDYDGIIVTHGTDTLQYTAVAVEYAVFGCNIPVIFVSSDYPLEDERANGYDNFKAAVSFIKSHAGNGVFVIYKNTREKVTNIHIPSHILKHSECSADIYSIDNMPYATFDGSITVNRTSPAPKNGGLGLVHYSEASGILVIDSHPGDSYAYSLEGIRAVLFIPYHSATLNTASTKFQSFCKIALSSKIPVFVLSAKSGTSYESAKLFKEMNIISLPYSTYISAYMKIWAALSLGRDVSKLAQTQVANEFII